MAIKEVRSETDVKTVQANFAELDARYLESDYMPNIDPQDPPIASASNLKIIGMDQNGSVGWISSNTLDSYYNERMAEDFALLGTDLSIEELLIQRSYLIGIRNIFASTAGIWYDPQDLTTTYQDPQGTLPVYRPGTGQVDPPVGLVLDKSQGLELGPELWDGALLAADGGTGSAGAYNPATGELSNGAVGTGIANPAFVGTNYVIEANKFYLVHLKFSGNLDPLYAVSLNRGSVSNVFENGIAQAAAIAAAGGDYTYIAGALNSTPSLRIATKGTSTWSGLFIEEISIREIKGYHAYQSTPTARPTLSGRYNLLTATDTLATQSVTTEATDYTLRFEGAGSITLSGAATDTLTAGTHTITCTEGTLTCTVDDTVTNADLRVKRDGSDLPEYQSVTDADTYDTAGFPLYLRRDLADDKHTLIVPTGGITGTRLQTTLDAATATPETMAEGANDLFTDPTAGPPEITQWLQFNKTLTADELETATLLSESRAKMA